jgi:hypothetical protein
MALHLHIGDQHYIVRRPRDQLPIPLDPDLQTLVLGKPAHIVQQIYAIQAERNASRFEPHGFDAPAVRGGSEELQKHPHQPKGAPASKGGQFAPHTGAEAGGEQPEEKEAKEPAEPPKQAEGPQEPQERPVQRGKAPAAPKGAKTTTAVPARKPAAPKPVSGETFVSPNVGDLSFAQAHQELSGKRQHALAAISDMIDRRLGITDKHQVAVLGAWQDGAENSLLAVQRGNLAAIRVAAAIKGHITNQKQVLVFSQDNKADSHMADFEAKGSLADIHNQLLKAGLDFHTLEPTADGAKVYVYTDNDATDAKINAAAKAFGSEVHAVPGKGVFIGDQLGTGTDDEQRARGRADYERIIKEEGGAKGLEDVASVWQDANDHWRSETDPSQTGLRGSHGHPALIATSRPSVKGSLESARYRRADVETMKQTPVVYQHNIGLFKDGRSYPQLLAEETEGKSDDEIATAIKEMAKKNLRFLMSKVPEEIRKQGHLWYEGAHNMAQRAADKYNIPLQSAAGVYAALSPQKLWDINVYLADHLMDVYFTKQNADWDEAMNRVAYGTPAVPKAAAPGGKAVKAVRGIWMPARKKDPTKGPTRQEQVRMAVLQQIRGKKLSEMQTLTEKAMWIRTYDEAHSPRHYDALSPDGSSLGTAMIKEKKNKAGKVTAPARPAMATWQSNKMIENALQALESNGDRNVISEAMGEKHKVRSFYNNILDPDSNNEDVTMDTHAVGAPMLFPSGSNDTAVLHSLKTGPKGGAAEVARRHFVGAKGSGETGIEGTYAIWADAYRELAHELHIKPRVLQSITWEAKRRLFGEDTPRAVKTRVAELWRDYHDHKATLEQTQNAIFNAAGGIHDLEATSAEDEGEEEE